MWAVLGAALGSAPLAALITWLLARRQNAATAEHVEAQAADVIKDAAIELIEPLRAQNREQAEEIRDLRKDVTALQQSQRELEGDRTVLAAAVREQVRWQQSGAPPPPPRVADHVLSLLDRLHTT